jgi:hypothetical protein
VNNGKEVKPVVSGLRSRQVIVGVALSIVLDTKLAKACGYSRDGSSEVVAIASKNYSSPGVGKGRIDLGGW